MRVYHAAGGAATGSAGRWLLVMAFVCTAAIGAARGAVLPPAAPDEAGAVRVRLESAVRALFADPVKLYKVIPLALPADDEAKTLKALVVLFRNVRVDEVTARGVSADGRVGMLRVRVSNVDVYGLRVDEMMVEAEDFAVDRAALMAGDVRVAGDARARMGARVLEDDLNRVSPSYKLELGDGDFAVSGRAGVLFIRAGYRLHGTLAATPENTLVFRPKSLSYGILPVPRPLYASTVRKLNPLFDMARFLGTARSGFDLRFEAVTLERGRAGVSLTGTIRAKPTPVEQLSPVSPMPFRSFRRD